MSFFRKPGPPQWIIAGLGNPEQKYRYNRHNAGFLCLDVLAEAYHAKVDRLKFHSLTGFAEIGGQRCLLMKPNTYMNRSGQAVGEAARFYQIPQERVLVIFDEIALPPGVLRIRRKGSAGGHNGIKSMVEHLGGEEFPRIKLGVGQKPDADCDLADWVLSDLSKEEQKALRVACGDACKAVELIVNGEIETAMARYSH